MKHLISSVSFLMLIGLLLFVTSCEKEKIDISDVNTENEDNLSIRNPNDSIPSLDDLEIDLTLAPEVPEENQVESRSNGFVITNIRVEKFRVADRNGNWFDKYGNYPDLQFRFANTYDNLWKSSRREKSEKHKNAVPGRWYSFYGNDMPFVYDSFYGARYVALFDWDSDRGLGSNPDELMDVFAISPYGIRYFSTWNGSSFTIDRSNYNGYKYTIYGYFY